MPEHEIGGRKFTVGDRTEECLFLLARGNSYQAIAEACDISISTVGNLLSQATQKARKAGINVAGAQDLASWIFPK
ncbi:hypothetical protein A3D84_02040 [Candidatus Woesebacteria bacterium RIFCSPHIGHO2_02_FULL_42_20]|uniref:Uncharacterized protein n=1 Tax=Candidatus Woesebacteria bacterium RIFCSPHIGHO2_12_FULL_41_24 TaxID=1802510 RepID=A0A1F8AT37_9BACT|nr:MAG: hypothetical protein A2W15_04320 [Candidatus Woesebacteria bacterium RBG_16_41_13]OGM30027.1 MAG: hypothetical protein A2873_04875 [Candidatus Woesebacteria bacterium RIFCSPHIGHO2_01_FULL_42_80]OGM35105.1 MAG: hypothetical protein A3D84_02040 [Candidatus Woesebacteria bacterium RIFCSPHIGHO2_02_FULL_42_20]OGM54841.1 MAG: hypothetical protein A3E44_01640 [Candidatus Woesebacteria bacterium RIFCSPHIGHO2_12_FULL_41_24]OGM67457.1 MAG: hypothetical protein A2969_05490 [Candidatus Woesebacteri